LRNAFGLVDPDEDRKKIALFTDTLSDVNGVAITIRRLAKAAPDHDAELVVLDCSCRPTGRDGDIMNFKAIGDIAIPEYDEMKLHFPPVLDVLDYITEEGFTAIHVSTPGPMGLLGLLISKLTDLPISGTYHTDVPQYVGFLTSDRAIEEGAWSYMVWFYNQLDRVLVPSCATRDQLLERGLLPEKPVPLPRWVDTDRFSPSLGDQTIWNRLDVPQQDVKLLYAGRVSREKNLPILVDAFLELERAGANATLIVAGDGPYREEMQRKLRGHKAVFTGFISQEELARMYASADAFVFPSTTDTFGNVVLEAQASGLPVIVTDQGGPQELLVRGRSGLVVRGGETEGLVQAMRYLVENPETRLEMALQARSFALRGRLGTSVQFSTMFGGKVDWSWADENYQERDVETAA
jgi:glycosyltransferase involved in cell wall biosynthesis